MALVPDEPEEIRIQQARQQFLIEKAILKLPDETLGDDEDSADNDPDGNSKKVFDIHTYHRDNDDVRASFRSNYRVSKT